MPPKRTTAPVTGSEETATSKKQRINKETTAAGSDAADKKQGASGKGTPRDASSSAAKKPVAKPKATKTDKAPAKAKAVPAKAKSRKSKADNEEIEDTSGLRRSSRANKGEGGVITRAADISAKIEKQPKKPKERVQGIPESQKINPMAPTAGQPAKRGRKPVTKAVPPVAPTSSHSVVPPQHLVPPGTEPQLPSAQMKAFGHQFGFLDPTITLPTPHNLVTKQVSTNLDPSLVDEGAAEIQMDVDQGDDDVEEPVEEEELGGHFSDMDGGQDDGEDGEEDGEDGEEDDEEVGRDDSEEDGEEDNTHARPAVSSESHQAAMFLVKRYGLSGTHYEDSRVTGMIEAAQAEVEAGGTEAFEGDDADELEEAIFELLARDDTLLDLLRSIHNDWKKEQGDDGETWIDQPTNEEDEAYDVLEAHHKKNRPVKPPLFDIVETDDELVEKSTTAAPSEVDPEDISTRRARRHSKKSFESSCDDPMQLQFYPEAIQRVLTSAKQNWRLWLVMNWGFPKFRERKAELTGCITRAIAAYEADGGALDKGYYPKYKQAMVKLVWEDSSSFRGELKRVARQQVTVSYGFIPRQPEPDSEERPLNPAQYRAHIKAAIADLVLQGQFMHNGHDKLGKTNNLTHPAIGDICRTFFYGSSTRLGHEFPQEFSSEVPDMAIALVITAIKCALDEWATGVFKSVPFAAEVYESPYETTVKLIAKVKADDYHGAKLKKAQRDWALSSSISSDQMPAMPATLDGDLALPAVIIMAEDLLAIRILFHTILAIVWLPIIIFSIYAGMTWDFYTLRTESLSVLAVPLGFGVLVALDILTIRRNVNQAVFLAIELIVVLSLPLCVIPEIQAETIVWFSTSTHLTLPSYANMMDERTISVIRTASVAAVISLSLAFVLYICVAAARDKMRGDAFFPKHLDSKPDALSKSWGSRAPAEKTAVIDHCANYIFRATLFRKHSFEPAGWAIFRGVIALYSCVSLVVFSAYAGVSEWQAYANGAIAYAVEESMGTSVRFKTEYLQGELLWITMLSPVPSDIRTSPSATTQQPGQDGDIYIYWIDPKIDLFNISWTGQGSVKLWISESIPSVGNISNYAAPLLLSPSTQTKIRLTGIGYSLADNWWIAYQPEILSAVDNGSNTTTAMFSFNEQSMIIQRALGAPGMFASVARALSSIGGVFDFSPTPTVSIWNYFT
ncbi:hypothetical protein HWV62_25082 [Athelia sp. TMB]|nr:hypothetical protein HWV62_25082 [Athelia sp. TMB]